MKIMKIYDCFTFFNEVDLVDIRMNVLNSHVDYFVVVESTKTYSGQDKDLIFKKNKVRFNVFAEKIIYIVVDDMPELKNNNRWLLEHFQRDAIIRGLAKCTADDMIMISDVDEMPNVENIDAMKQILTMNTNKKDILYILYSTLIRYISHIATNKFTQTFRKVLDHFQIKSKRMVSCRQKFYYYYLNGFIHDKWIGTRAVLYKDIMSHYNLSPQQIRNSLSYEVVENGGWHFSYLSSPEEIAKKIKSFAHSEYDKPEYTDVDTIKRRVINGEDLFGRKEKIKYVEIDATYPKFIRKNMDIYKSYIHDVQSVIDC